MVLFDDIILAKRNRGRSAIFSGRSMTDFLSDTSDHLWRTASASFPPSGRAQREASGDYSHMVTRGKLFIPRIFPFLVLSNEDINLYSTGKTRTEFDEGTSHDSWKSMDVQGG